MTVNKYGKCQAIYVGLAANSDILNPLLDDLISEFSIKKGPDVRDGVIARQIDKNHFLYLNVNGEPKEIKMKEKSVVFFLIKITQATSQLHHMSQNLLN